MSKLAHFTQHSSDYTASLLESNVSHSATAEVSVPFLDQVVHLSRWLSSQLPDSLKHNLILKKHFYLALRCTCMLIICWLIGRIGFSVLWIALLIGLLLGGLQRQRRALHLHHTLHFQHRLHDAAILRETLSKQSPSQELPSWISFFEFEKAAWLQCCVDKCWPYLKEATEGVLWKSLPPILQASTPSFLTHLGLNALDLGNIPVTINGVKLQSHDASEVMLDVDLDYAGNPNIVVEARTGPLVVYATLANFHMRCCARIILKPLMTEWPCFTCLSICFTHKPAINFKLETGAVNVMSIPGFNSFIYDLITNILASSLVFPKKVVIPMIEGVPKEVLDSLSASEPTGVLQVSVGSLRDLRGSDVYVKLSMNTTTHKTQPVPHIKQHYEYKGQALEQFEFIVIDARTETLHCAVKSKDSLMKMRSGGIIGTCQVPVDSVINSTHNKAHNHDYYIPLHGKQGGKLHLKINFKPFKDTMSGQTSLSIPASDATSARNASDNKRSSITRQQSLKQALVDKCSIQTTPSQQGERSTWTEHKRGLLIVTLVSASNLKRPSSSSENRSLAVFATLTVGKLSVRSDVVTTNTGDVEWNDAAFEFPIVDSHTEQLFIEFKDKNRFGKDVTLGELTLTIHHIATQQSNKQQTHTLANAQAATVTLTTWFKEY